MPWYCLFCKAGQEQSVIRMLEERGARPLAPLAVHMRPGQKGMERVRQRLLPGYVFFVRLVSLAFLSCLEKLGLQ